MRWLAPFLLLLPAASAGSQDKTYLVSGFDRVRVDGPFEVVLAEGPTRASASGDEQALRRLTLRVDGGTLVIGSGAGGWSQPTGAAPSLARVSVSAPALRSLSLNGGGRVQAAAMKGARVEIGLNGGGTVSVARIEAEELHVTLSGTGAMTLGGTARRARVRSNGAGSIDAAGLMAGDATLLWESAGGLRIGVRYTGAIFALGLGTVEVIGTPECRISGNGPVLCQGRVVRR